MARTTVEKVRAVLPSVTQLTDPQIEAAIEAATCVVDQIASDCASDLSEDCLTIVETYLAAHYCAVTEFTLNISSEKDACSGGQATYGWKLGEGVKGSPYGQMANTLAHGCLVQLDAAPVGMFSIGCH